MSRLLSWASRRRSAVATGLSSVLIAAVVAGVAVVSTGYEAQRLDLDDGTVWVANGARSAVGRANADVRELNAAVRTTGTDLAIAQSGQDVLLVDRTAATVGVVDPATATLGDTVPLPPESPEVAIAGDRALIVSQGTGELWSQPLDSLASFSSDVDADLSLGADVVTSVSPAGVTTVFSAETAVVTRIDSPDDLVVSSTATTTLTGDGPFQVTSVGGRSAVLDLATGELVVDGALVDLGADVEGGLALQQAADDGDGVLVATSSSLLRVPFSGGEPEEVVTGQAGAPARPVVVAGCSYAAWAGGSAWSDCSGARGGLLELDGVPATSGLVLAVHGEHVVLNDPVGGRSWAVQGDGSVIDNWDELLDEEQQEEQQENDSTDEPPELDPDQKAPVAVDDALGARPGRASTLPVLLNDYDPNGDPLVVEGVGEIDPAVGRLDLVNDRQQVLLTLADDAVGTVLVDYTVSDGRGGTDSAVATVTIRQGGENGPPTQVRRSTASVSSAGRVSTAVLGDWVDPDGDAFYLTSASGADGVSYKPSGDVVYQDPGAGADTVDLSLAVSDGQAEGRGQLVITVGGAATLRADSFTVQAYAGRQITVRPLDYARGGSGEIRLNSVPAKAGSTVTPSYDAGTFRFVSDEVRTHNLEYTVTDGDQTATGVVRIDVQSPPDPSTPPVTTPKTVFVETLSAQTLDVVATDLDPAGNVLMVTGTSEVPLSTGVRVETLEQRYLRITLAAPLEGPVGLTYTVSNGLATAEGTVTVVEIPRRQQTQPPVATDDQVTVRVGDAIDIDVLANDEQPDGDDLTLVADLVRGVPADGGLLFTSATKLRYLAPATPGNVTAVYAVRGSDGQIDSAQVSISVREADASTNNAPVPQTVTARVVAGQTVRVSVPLADVDPDGDSVSLLGIGTSPEKGNVTEVGADYVQYQANASAAGTDEFTYTVVDGLGARATGKLRIGIAARADGSRNPVAVADVVTMRPGGTVTVRVLENDSDPDGGALTVTQVQASDEATTAEVVDGSLVEVTPPRAEGSYGLVYTVENAQGGSSSSFVTVTVDADAPLNRPTASDTVLDLADISGRESVDVAVLANVFFADGPVSELGLGIEPGYDGTSVVTSDRRVRVTLTDRAQIIPFFVTHPDDAGVRATAFIRVPGFDDALPQLDKRARPVTVVSGERVVVDLSRYVIAAGGKAVRLTNPGAVRATHANGDDLVVDPTTLAYTSADLYFGAASLSFEVTDGTSADDPEGRTATLVLPVTVTPRENQPPTFTGTSIALEPGESRTLDLTRLTTYPYPDALAELRFEARPEAAAGFTVDVSGQRMTVTADAGTPKGTSRTLPVSVRDSVSTGQSGAVQLAVVGSSRPLAQPVADTQAVRRGSTASIDVLANDQATNPFPGQPLRVVDIRGLGGGGLPAGVSVTPSADNRTLAVAVGAGAAPGDANLQYRVADVTGDPERQVWGNVTISVQDVPAQPAAPTRSGSFRGGELTLSYAAPQANNSPITRFRLVGTGSGGSPYSKDCGLSTVCTLTDLAPEQTYQFAVVATNAVGDSPASALSDSYSADFVPAAPNGVSVTPSRSTPGALDVSWNAVPKPTRGTAVTGYVVERAGAAAQSTSATSVTLTGLAADQVYGVTISARNRAQVSSDADWARSSTVSARAVGTPSAPTSVRAEASRNSVTVSWQAPADLAGGASATYSVWRQPQGAGASGCSATGTPLLTDEARTSVTDTPPDGTWSYVVVVRNGYFCASGSASSEAVTPPGQASGSVTVESSDQFGNFDLRAEGLAATGLVDRFQYRVGSGAWTDVPADRFLATDSPSGNTLSVAFRACRVGASRAECGTESSPTSATPVATRTAGAVCAVGQPLSVSDPVNGPDASVSATTVEFRLVTLDVLGVPIASSWTTEGPDGVRYTRTSTVPSNADAVRVTTTVDADGTSYTDPGSFTTSCS
ncbi:tandem-95 repeat protein [Frigoribacterium sp. CFBP 8754]|uniref:Ig-like domain-containing protein n=1 Tax=Frigoribacterium sp. CFBP 8754 TaxID=2775290 RepID=UPI00177D77A1|nr:tandem-95 repeat protein [Frigoribacterium sp. CFBP 8754]